MNYKVFQYVPMSKPKALTKMLPRIIKSNGIVVLDIEDSVQDTLNPLNTSNLKNEARNSIPSLIESLIEQKININNNIYIRVNSNESGELDKDLNVIKILLKKLDSLGIFLPMVNNIADIENVKKILGKDFYKVKIVPIIETVQGLNNLKNILDKNDGFNIEYIHYGHYDYSLDSEQWPFLNQDDKLFWKFIDEFISLVEKSTLKYMHTPFGQLSDESLYKSIIKKLNTTCNKTFAVTALNYNQVLFAQNLDNVTDINLQDRNEIDKIILAKDIIDIFENNQCSKRSFSVDVKKAKFLTPHEYNMAKKYLKEII